MSKYPITTRPEDVTKLLQKIQTVEIPPNKKIDVSYIKSLKFSLNSSESLLDILKKLGFINEKDEPSIIWSTYIRDENRGSILASAIKKAYPELFDLIFCPYLEGDETLTEFFKHEEPELTNKDLGYLIDTFRNLSDLADFQDIMCEGESQECTSSQEEPMANVKVNPNLQLNIQIHIDPNTPDEKIETIFKNMRKYLLEKENQK